MEFVWTLLGFVLWVFVMLEGNYRIKMHKRKKMPKPVDWGLVEKLSKENDFYLPNFYIWKDVFEDPPKDPRPKEKIKVKSQPMIFYDQFGAWESMNIEIADWLAGKYNLVVVRDYRSGYAKVQVPRGYRSIQEYMLAQHDMMR